MPVADGNCAKVRGLLTRQELTVITMRIGFACAWKDPPEKTWSGTASRLRDALGHHADVVDLGVEYSSVQTLLKYLYARKLHGHWGSTFDWSAGKDKFVERKLRPYKDGASADAVVEINDLARFEVPFYVYKDLSFAVLEKHYDPVAGAPGFNGIDLDGIKYRKERQHEIWDSATGIFAMSGWLADTLVELSDVPRDKITVVYAGLNSVETNAQSGSKPAFPDEGRRPAKLLFVGRDFFRKGGDIVVKALERLRREYSAGIRLTVVGPDKWPLPGNVPEGVVFLGSRTPMEVASLYPEHDLFVMPSRFEAFGIVFTEALAHGLPVIGRSAFAMPEIIEPGKNGALVDGEDPTELAAAIVGVLEDPGVREYTVRAAKDVRTRFSWDTVAERMLAAIAASM